MSDRVVDTIVILRRSKIEKTIILSVHNSKRQIESPLLPLQAKQKNRVFRTKPGESRIQIVFIIRFIT